MDRIEREHLKSDPLAQGLGQTVDYVKVHRQQTIRIAAAALVVLLLAGGIWGYMKYTHGQREAALNEALRAQNGQIGQAQNEYIKAYPTQAAKDADVNRLLAGVVSKYSGSDEAAIAEFLMGTSAADKGNLPEAEKHLKNVADSGPKDYASQAKLSLAQVYVTENKMGEAESLLKNLQANPTVMVSKEQATVALARIVALKNPTEARKLLEPLQSERAAVSRVALTAISELPR